MGRLIKQINFPADLRKFKKDDLKQISEELRDELIDVVSETGGHLGAGLGVVELTIALHYVFDTPKDKLIWDTTVQHSSVISAPRRCSLRPGALANTLVVRTMLARIRENYCVTVRRHHRKWIQFRCLSFSAPRLRITIFCEMVLQGYSLPLVNSPNIVRHALPSWMS